MSMKKILMAAAAVTALTAGLANAATINPTSTIGGKAIGSGTAASPTFDPYTLAKERKLTKDTIFGNTTTPTANNLKLTVDASGDRAIGVGEYLVTFNITNGSFDTEGLGTSALAPTGVAAAGAGGAAYAGTTTGTSTVSAGTISFIVKVTGGNLNKLVLDVGVKTGTSKETMSISGSIVTLSGSVNVDGGSFGSVDLVDYRDGMKFSATAVDANLSLASGFKKFGTGSSDKVETNIAKEVKFAQNKGTAASDVVYEDFAGGQLEPADISSIELTVGGDLSAFNAKLGTADGEGSQGADAVATKPAVITASSTNTATGTATSLRGGTGAFITLAQKSTPVAGSESKYTVTPVITYTSTDLVPLTYAAKTIGAVTFEGASFFATWVGDGTNGIDYIIRLGNRTNTKITSVKASLMNPLATGTSGTVASTATCEVGPIEASSELLVRSQELRACFGNFKRSDVRFIIQTAASNLTAKMRTVSGTSVSDSPLGTGTSTNYGASN